MSNHRVAAVDIGTNSVLLLVAEQRGAELVPVVEHAEVTRLGQGVDATRRLADEAVERTLACLARYGSEIRAAGVERVDAVGTSAMRDATGGAAFVERARDLLGVAPRVVSGDEEAALTYEGARSGLRLDRSYPVTVFDVGGGSTEIISAEPGGPHARVSLDVGSVRLTERHLRTDPPSADEIAKVRSDVRRALEGAERPSPMSQLVGVAGTVTTLAAVLQGLSPYDGARVHGAPISSEELGHVLERLAAMPLSERKEVSGLDPARADVIVAGAIVVDEIVRWAGAPRFVASDRGVRWGLAHRLAGAAPAA